MTRCLMLVDLQNDYFPSGKMALDGIENAARNAQLILQHYRDSHLPVIHVQHLSIHSEAAFFLPETVGAAIHDLLTPLEDESVIQKNYPNSFRDTSLLEVLQKSKISELAICGAMTHMCIDATTRAAFDLGFNCIVAEDACATRDLIFRGRTVPAVDVHAAFMGALAGTYADVRTTEDLLTAMA